jgi:cation diffusion facilitator CzcD-associated flavoprotein CzcO
VEAEHYDAIIIGAGISGISAAYHLQKHCPEKRYKIIERREQLGGTWDLFNYPGIRSDSDMYTFGFSFRPWSDDAAIAEKSKIIDYLTDTVEEYGIDQHIEYGIKIQQAKWSSKAARWTLHAVKEKLDEPLDITAQFIFMCVGYYDYDAGYRPKFAGEEDFSGAIIHPQHWPEGFEYKGKNIAVIGSGATAVTLIPSMAEQANHITMIQRSPTYMGAKPAKDPIANKLAAWFGRRAARWWFILSSMFIYAYCKLFPQRAKKEIIDAVKDELGDKFEAKHFTPSYDPWDQRVCLCPDADFFKAIKKGKASIETDLIERIDSKGVQLNSGGRVDADIIVTATGLNMLFVGGIELFVDDQRLTPGDLYIYKGLMCNSVPNLFSATGYTNASWTLKVDLTNKYACRLINYLDKHDYQYCMPEIDSDVVAAPLLDLSSGYIQRSISEFPRQATRRPWRLYQNYIYDKLTLALTPLRDKTMKFCKIAQD